MHSAVAQGVAPTVTSSFSARTAYENDRLCIAPVVSGTESITYQWFLNGTNLPSQTNFAVFFRAVELTDAGTYSVVVSNSAGTTSAAVASLYVQPFRHNKLVGWFGSDATAYEDHCLDFDDVEDVVDFFSAAANVAVLHNGSVLSWGPYNSVPQRGLSNVTMAVTAPTVSEVTTFVLRKDGTVACWDSTTNFALNVTGVVGISACSAALDGVLLLKGDGTVTIWDHTQFTAVSSLSNIISALPVSGGVLALQNDGSVVASGISLPAGLTNVVGIASGGSTHFAIKEGGELLEWNSSGYVSISVSLTNVIAVSADSETNVVAVQADGKLVRWGNAIESPSTITNAIAVRAGPANLALLAIEKDTNQIEVVSQIYNENVLVADSTTLYVQAQSATPVHYQWARLGTNIAGATGSTLALQNVQPSDAGTYTVTISNDFGAVLNTEAQLHVSPTNTFMVRAGYPSEKSIVPPGLGHVVAVAGGGGIDMALRVDGTVAFWGPVYDANYIKGQDDFTNVAAIAATESQSLYGLRRDGTVAGCGWSGGRQPPAGLRHVVQISATSGFVMALKSDGRVVTWGSSSNLHAFTSGLTNIATVRAGPNLRPEFDCGAVVDRSGVVSVFGNFAQPTQTISNAIDVAIGLWDADFRDQGLALHADGTVDCWNNCGFTPPPNVVAIADRAALDRDGKLYIWWPLDVYPPAMTEPQVLFSNVVSFVVNPGMEFLAVVTEVPQPQLMVQQQDTNMVLSWQSYSTWILESTTDVGNAQWVPVSDGAVDWALDMSANTVTTVTVPQTTKRFFRLRYAQ